MGRSNTRRLRSGKLKVRWTHVRSSGRHIAFDELRPAARLAIGLVQSTSLTREEMASIIGVTLADFESFWKTLLRDRFADKIIAAGMPAIYGEDLPSGCSVRCRHCKEKISRVPCVKCWPDLGDPDGTKEGDVYQLPDCGHGVVMEPGSYWKIETMRSRVEAGFSPFCEKDSWDFGDDAPAPFVEEEPEIDIESVLFEDFLAKIARNA
jgi:hypothetical protein